MIQRAVMVADGGEIYAPRPLQERAAAHRDGVKRGDCPLKIIVRGILFLSIAGVGFGYALVGGNPIAKSAAASVTNVQTDLPVPLVNVSWAPDAVTFVPASPSPASTPIPQNARVRRTFLRMLQTALSSQREVLQFGPMHVKRSLVETIMKAARDTHSDPVLLMAIADKESSFATGVEARTSSAMGLFQFVDSTWLRVVRAFGAEHGLAKEAAAIEGPPDRLIVADAAMRSHILGLRSDPYLSSVLAGEMLKHDGNRIAQRIGRGLTSGETYLAHFLGPDDAEKFMEKVVGQPHYMAAALLPKPARANASIFYARAGRRATQLSVAAVHDKFEEMMGMRLDRYKSIGAAAELSAYADLDGH